MVRKQIEIDCVTLSEKSIDRMIDVVTQMEPGPAGDASHLVEHEESHDEEETQGEKEKLEDTISQVCSLEATAMETAMTSHNVEGTLDASVAETLTTNAQLGHEESTRAHDASAFNTWSIPSAGVAPYQIGPFVLLLLDEFCRHYALNNTATAFHNELQELGVEFPNAGLWFDMYGQCSSILSKSKHQTNPFVTATTIEQLVEFCVNPQARKAVFSLDMATAHSPMHVCASPKKISTTTSGGGYTLMTAYQQLQSPIVRPSQRSSMIPTDTRKIFSSQPPSIDDPPTNGQEDHPTHLSPSRLSASPSRKSSIVSIHKNTKKKKRKGRLHRSQSVMSVVSHSSGHHSLPTNNPLHVTAGTYGEPVLVDAHKTDLKRDLTSTRLLEKELRHVRLEQILTGPMISTQKKLGFYTLSPDEAHIRQQLQDPYASELILEKYDITKRQECGLCQFSYLQYNLPHKVSFKCIMDVYDHWQYVPPDRETATKYKAPLCYDAVQVCRMCAQIVFQFAKQPQTEMVRPLSRKHKKAKSLANLQQAESTEDSSFVSDPYALPPLMGDDVIDQREALIQYANTRRARGLRIDGDAVEGDGRPAGMSEYPSKAIVYSQQMDGGPLLTSKEWNVINPEKSLTRHRMEASIAVALSRNGGSHG